MESSKSEKRIEETRRHFEQANFPAVCKTCDARFHGICGALRVPDLIALSRYTKQRPIRKGDVISFEQDDVIDYANIVSGVVKLTKVLADGRQQIVGLQFAPEFVGRPFTQSTIITAEAATDGQICVFPKRAMEAMLDKAPDFERRLFEQTLQQLDASREWLLMLGRKTASEKVASFLVHLCRKIGRAAPGGGLEVELPLTRAEMADFLGLTIETVSRQMTRLRKSRIVNFEMSSRIHVPNLAALEAAAETDQDR